MSDEERFADDVNVTISDPGRCLFADSDPAVRCDAPATTEVRLALPWSTADVGVPACERHAALIVGNERRVSAYRNVGTA